LTLEERLTVAHLTRRTFSKAGYSVALIARGEDTIKQFADELNASGGDVCTFLSF
jgi:NADP-dependent 3-hydroxy acid dehydrogenase YdfG